MKNLLLLIGGAALGAGAYYLYNESQKGPNKPPGVNTVPNGTVIYSSAAQAPSGPNFGKSVVGKGDYGKKKKLIALPHLNLFKKKS